MEILIFVAGLLHSFVPFPLELVLLAASLDAFLVALLVGMVLAGLVRIDDERSFSTS